ncbi:MAG: TonB-dependent siderophore receptor [Flavobacteriaceae bacterium]|nr:TonB-dependent siderophore receptor [Flavobacteriaceae bacterium]
MSSLLMSLMGYSQMVKGRVVQHDNPVSNASIILKKGDKEMTSMTDASGFFNVTLTEGGSYTISIVAEGANPLENQITVEDNGVLDLGDVIVYQMVTSQPVVEEKPVVEQPTEPTEPVVAKNTTDPNEPQDEEEDGKVKKLQTVEIIGRARKDYNSDYSFSASKIALKNMEVPQAITTVTKELIADKGVTRLGDVVKNVSGVTQTSFYNNYAIRGVTQQASYRESRLMNGMVTSHIFFSQPMMMNVERVEVIKGPASMTFSSTDAGGSINIITKKPLKTDRKEVSLSVGSYQTVVGALDFTGPLNKSKTLLYRLNLGYENGKSFRDLQFKKAYMIAPTIAYVPNEKTNISFEFVMSNNSNRLDRGQPIFKANPGDRPALTSTPITYAIGAINDINKTLDLNFMGNLTHKFTDNLSINMAYMKHIWNEDLTELRTDNNFGKDSHGVEQKDKVQLRYVQRNSNFFTDNFNAYLNYDWKLGENFKNKSVLGYDLVMFEVGHGGTNTVRDYTGNAALGTLTPRIPHWDLTKEGQYRVMYPGFYQPQARRMQETTPMYFSTNSAYFMNQMELWNRLIFNIGLRQEWYTDKNFYKRKNEETVKQNKFLVRAGLMYKATKNINAYASYIEGFQMQTDAYLGYDGFRRDMNTGQYVREAFKPKTTRMYEFGAKTEWFEGKLHASIAYYDIKQNNILTYDDTVYNGAVDELMTEGGTERNKGLEIDVMGRILPNWLVNAGYAYNDSKVTDQKRGTYRKDNAPKHTFNLWTRFDVKEGFFKNLGVGAGLNYSAEKISWQEPDLVLPDYTIIDAAVYYKIKDMQLSFNINNIFNKTYWLGAFNYPRLFPGTPRNVMFTVRYTF